MSVYLMTCGACGEDLHVPHGTETINCPGCRQDRYIGGSDFWAAVPSSTG
ncbi:hypothetical protein ACWDOR_43235 [Streptosporangium canum]